MKNKSVLLINDTSYEAHIGSRTVVSTIRTLCKKNNLELFATLTRAEIIELAHKLDELIETSDIILINGEGSLHHHPRVATQFFPYFMSKVPHSKPVALINALWQENNYETVHEDLQKINLISVRESLSYQDIIQFDVRSKVRIVPDLIFYNDIIPSHIGYCDSVSQKIRNTFKRKPNYFPLNFIDQGTYLQPKELTYPTLEAYISWLKSLELFITGRFHGVCLSMIAETPFLTYPSNSHKIEGLLLDANCSDLLIQETRDIKKKQHLAKLHVQNMRDYVASAKGQIDNFFKEVAKL